MTNAAVYSGGAQLRALVIDDDPHINRLLRARLTARGYHADGAADGAQALERLTTENADMLFLDVSLPDMSGLDVLERVRAQQRDTAVIITTAFGSETVAIDALRLGADDYLRKPFEPAEFGAVLDRTAARLLLRRQNQALRVQLDEKHRQLEAELAHAADVQADLLPGKLSDIPHFELASKCVPAREVGGDFYDWQQPDPSLLSFWLCDVMGKGMPAALLMATVRAVMRAVVRRSPPYDAIRYIQSAMEDDFVRNDRFVTLFLAQLDTTTHRLRYIDAGHGHVFVRRANGHVDLLHTRGLPLGILPGVMYQEGYLSLDAGDALVVYSDGLLDARPDLPLKPELLASYLDGAESAVAMVDRLVTFIDPSSTPPDDLTLLVLRCNEARALRREPL